MPRTTENAAWKRSRGGINDGPWRGGRILWEQGGRDIGEKRENMAIEWKCLTGQRWTNMRRGRDKGEVVVWLANSLIGKSTELVAVIRRVTVFKYMIK